MERFVQTGDSRTLLVEGAGDRAGRPVLVHVGTPNSRHLYGRTVRAIAHVATLATGEPADPSWRVTLLRRAGPQARLALRGQVRYLHDADVGASIVVVAGR
jgi:hypothetical protein